YHQSCTINTDCCTDNCVAGKCELAASSCLPVGDQCTPMSSPGCCTGACDLDPGGVYRCMDVGECKSFGAACTQAADCCSLSCVGGTCSTTSTCVKATGSCLANIECCDNHCVIPNGATSGTCTTLGTGCTTLGESCTSNSNCCSGFCEIPSGQPAGR